MAPQASRQGAGANSQPQFEESWLQNQLTRLRWSVAALFVVLLTVMLAYAYRNYAFVLEQRLTIAQASANSLRLQLDNALRHMDDVLGYTNSAFMRYGPGLMDSDTLAEIQGRQQVIPYRNVLIITAAGDALMSVPPNQDVPLLQSVAQAQADNTDGVLLTHLITIHGENILARSMRLSYSDGTYAGAAVALLDPVFVHAAMTTARQDNAVLMQLVFGDVVLDKLPNFTPFKSNEATLTTNTIAKDMHVQVQLDEGVLLKTWLYQMSLPAVFSALVVVALLWGVKVLRQSLKQGLISQRNADKSQLESQIRAMFIANMSHEIRTPMNGVLGAADLLARSPLNDKQQELLGLMQRSGENLMVIINDILDFSKLEAGQFPLENKSISLRHTIEDVITLQAATAQKKGLSLHCDLTFSPDLRIHSDPLRLQQIVTNLIGNAIKFTAAGRVRLLGETYTNSLGDWLKLSVQDTGIGLQADQIERLFIPFQQADDSHARRYGGTGLGLTITRHLVQLFGGTIRVDSAPDQGALFVVNLPIHIDTHQPLANDNQEVAAQALHQQQVIQCPGLKVLVVEDHPVNQTIISTILRNMLCEVQLAANGLQALERIQAQPFDLVLMDCQMPEMDGFEAVTLLRKREALEGNTSRLPVIALTALAMKGDADRCLACGMDDYLSKPINRGLLEEKIAFWAKTLHPLPSTAIAPPATARA